MQHEELFKQIEAFLAQKQDVYMDHLQQMIGINSFTTNPAGVDALGKVTADLFAPLGFTAESIPSVNPHYGHHLVMTRNGRSDQKIGLVSHLDTVFPAEEEIANNFAWRIERDRVYGPGTVDIKGGTIIIFMMMDALQQFAPTLFESVTWVILLDASEESDGTDFGALCAQRLADDAQACLIFEGGLHDNGEFNVVVARKGMAVYEAQVEGRASHAGSAHERGANAIVQMAEVIQKIAGFTNYDDEITFNVGTVTGGTVTNRVPHETTAKIEMRAFDAGVYDRGVAKMLALNSLSTVHSAADGYPCRVSVRVTRKTRPWPRNENTDHLLAVWQAAGASLGYVVHPEERGGLSDGNYFWDRVPTIDGMGAAGGNAHCSERSADGSKDQEYALISSFIPKTLLNVAGIMRLLG